MKTNNWRNDHRILGRLGSLFLVLGIVFFTFIGEPLGGTRNWLHGVGGLFMGMSIILSLRAGYLTRQHGEGRCGTAGQR